MQLIKKQSYLPFSNSNEWFENKRWNKNYRYLKKFHQKFNRMPDQCEKFEHLNLGFWCFCQKQYYKHNKLKPYQIDKLQLFSQWKWDIELPLNTLSILKSVYQGDFMKM